MRRSQESGLSTVKQPETDDAVLVALKAAFEADDAKAIDILGAALKNSPGSAVLQEALAESSIIARLHYPATASTSAQGIC